jgi:hypothetical protein
LSKCWNCAIMKSIKTIDCQFSLVKFPSFSTFFFFWLFALCSVGCGSNSTDINHFRIAIQSIDFF